MCVGVWAVWVGGGGATPSPANTGTGQRRPAVRTGHQQAYGECRKCVDEPPPTICPPTTRTARLGGRRRLGRKVLDARRARGGQVGVAEVGEPVVLEHGAQDPEVGPDPRQEPRPQP